MNHIHLPNDCVLGDCEWKGKLDLLNIVMIGLAKELPPHDDTYELHRLLGALLSKDLTVDEKLNIMDIEYDIPIEDKLREDVSVMCNLSQGIVDKTKAEIILNMHENDFTLEQIALATKQSVEEVKKIIEDEDAVTV